jgi:hypothetical protein
VDRKGIRTDPKKIEAVVSFPIPKNKTDLRAFMGLASYYRDFVAHFASHVDILNKALKRSNDPFSFPRECQEAFQLIKDKLTSTPFLKRPDFTKEFSLHTDACSTGLGAILSQRNKHQQERVISYASRSTSPTERNYGATDLELLAVVWALKKYRHYLLGRRFRLYTDHSAIKSLYNAKATSGLHARWIMKMQQFDIDIVLKPGTQHGNVDAISRNPAFVIPLPKKGPIFQDE